jgi:Mg2+/citrate symporter
MSEVKKRRSHLSKTKTISSNASKSSNGNEKSKDKISWVWSYINLTIGLIVMVACGVIHKKYMYTIHENALWFSNIKVSCV